MSNVLRILSFSVQYQATLSVGTVQRSSSKFAGTRDDRVKIINIGFHGLKEDSGGQSICKPVQASRC